MATTGTTVHTGAPATDGGSLPPWRARHEELREAAARAIFEAGQGAVKWPDLTVSEKDEWRAAADAALRTVGRLVMLRLIRDALRSRLPSALPDAVTLEGLLLEVAGVPAGALDE